MKTKKQKKNQKKKVRHLNFAWPLFHVSACKHVILHGQSASIKKQHGVVKEASGFSNANGILVWPRMENISIAYDNLIYFELSVLSLCKDLLH